MYSQIQMYFIKIKYNGVLSGESDSTVSSWCAMFTVLNDVSRFIFSRGQCEDQTIGNTGKKTEGEKNHVYPQTTR